MSFLHMKPFHDLINDVCTSISEYIDYLELQSERNSSHQGTPADSSKNSLDAYTVVKLKQYVCTKSASVNNFQALDSAL